MSYIIKSCKAMFLKDKVSSKRKTSIRQDYINILVDEMPSKNALKRIY